MSELDFVSRPGEDVATDMNSPDGNGIDMQFDNRNIDTSILGTKDKPNSPHQEFAWIKMNQMQTTSRNRTSFMSHFYFQFLVSIKLTCSFEISSRNLESDNINKFVQVLKGTKMQ